MVWDRAHRRAGSAGHRVAMPAHRRLLRASWRAPPQAREITRKTGPGDRRLFLRQQDPLDSRPRSRRPRPRARWRAAVRQHRHLADLEAHQRRGARHRSLQRLAHHAHEPGDGRLGRRSAAHLRRPARHAAAHRAVERRGGRDRGRAPGRAQFPSPASRAISRRRWPGRPASAPGFPRTPTAPAASRCCTPAGALRSRRIGCWPRARRRTDARRRNSPSKAASSSPAPRCSGCAIELGAIAHRGGIGSAGGIGSR